MEVIHNNTVTFYLFAGKSSKSGQEFFLCYDPVRHSYFWTLRDYATRFYTPEAAMAASKNILFCNIDFVDKFVYKYQESYALYRERHDKS